MNSTAQLMWTMVLLVMVPTASLSAIYSYFSKDVIDQMGSKYLASSEAGRLPHAMESSLMGMNEKIYQYMISSPDAKRALATDIRSLSEKFTADLAEYRNVPSSIRQMTLENEAIGADRLLQQINSDWEQYQYSVFAILSLPDNSDFVPLSRAILVDLTPTYDRLLLNIERAHGDDEDVANSMYQDFVRSYRMSFVYGTVAAAFSAAAALSVVLLLLNKYSIRLEPKQKLVVKRSESS